MADNSTLRDLFMTACDNRNNDHITACLTLGVNVNCVDGDNWTGLMHVVNTTASTDCDSALDILLGHHDIDINKKDNENCTALNTACFYQNHLAVARLCRMPGLQLNTVNTDGYSPVHYIGGDCFRALIVNEVDWNAKLDGDSPIMMAFKKGNVQKFKILMGISCVDMDTGNSQNRTLRMVAR